MYVYIKSERAGHQGCTHDLFTVGFYDPTGQWHPDSDHTDEQEAATRVNYLNGGRAGDDEAQSMLRSAVRDAFEHGVCVKARFTTRGDKWREKHAKAIEIANAHSGPRRAS